MRKIALLVCLACCLPLFTFAAQVDSVKVYSKSMKKEVPVLVISPDKAQKEACPVLYLLHGASGTHKTWLVNIKTNLPQIADEKGIFIVCPDGANTSWYWDSPLHKEFRYETFISSELINYVDKHYATIAKREGRAITGLSMGGHGALYNAMRHKDVFGAAGSTSGGVDIRPFPNKWNMKYHLGELKDNIEVWNEHTVVNQLDRIQNKDLALIIDCGVDDFFLKVNQELHLMLLQRKIEHDFILRPGAHNWPYWRNSIDYQILFFSKYFNEALK